MRGEKVDLESIKNTIKSDLEGFKQKATVVGGEIKQKAEEFGNEMKNRSGGIRKDISSMNGPRNGIGHAIGVLFKAFFLFITAIITFALAMALIGLIFSGWYISSVERIFYPGFLAEYYGLGCIVVFPGITGSWSANLADTPYHWREKGQ